MNILFFVDSLDGGGGARLIATISNGLSALGHKITIATDLNRPVQYEIDNAINLECWQSKDYHNQSQIFRVVNRMRRARTIIKKIKPEVIVSTYPHIVFISRIAGIGLKTPYVFADITSFTRKDGRFTHFVRYHFYKIAERVTVQTENDRKVLGKRLPNKVVICNPLSYPLYYGKEKREKWVLAIGHTDRWQIKGFDILFKSWASISTKFPDWRLKIIGGESDKSRHFLDEMLKQYNILDSVDFLGFRTDADAVMRQSSVFALSSRIEGFSISLIEALSQGIPAIAFKINDVITDVTGNGHGTVLVEDGDVDGFTCGLTNLINDEGLREKLSTEGREFVKKYDASNIVKQWEKLLEETAKRN